MPTSMVVPCTGTKGTSPPTALYQVSVVLEPISRITSSCTTSPRMTSGVSAFCARSPADHMSPLSWREK